MTQMTLATPRNRPRRGLVHLLLLGLIAVGCGGSGAQTQLATTTPTAAAATEVGPVVQVAADASTPTPSSVADLVQHLAPMVVNITTVQRPSMPPNHPLFDFFGPQGPGMPPQRVGAGTGFVIDPAGYVITNAHVVQDAEEVQVRLQDDRHFSAEVIGRDRKLDLALLKVVEAEGLPAVTLGDSDALRVGEQVIAVGNPFGLGHTVTMGIVSAKDRTIGAGPYDDFIQTDASINPGNSGGPLFNLRGEVIGINTAIRAGADGIGFAIPVAALRDVLGQLKDKGFVERGKLGLAFQPITPALAKALGLDRVRGALVSEVMAGSSAAKAGIQPGDVVVAVNGVTIRRAEELPRNVARHAPGTTIDVQLVRQDEALTVKATLDKLEDDDEGPPQRSTNRAPTSKSELLGIEVEDLPEGGVRVTALTKPLKDLRPGDVIVEVNGETVRDVAALRDKLKRLDPESTALLRVRRGEHQRYVGIPLSP